MYIFILFVFYFLIYWSRENVWNDDVCKGGKCELSTDFSFYNLDFHLSVATAVVSYVFSFLLLLLLVFFFCIYQFCKRSLTHNTCLLFSQFSSPISIDRAFSVYRLRSLFVSHFNIFPSLAISLLTIFFFYRIVFSQLGISLQQTLCLSWIVIYEKLQKQWMPNTCLLLCLCLTFCHTPCLHIIWAYHWNGYKTSIICQQLKKQYFRIAQLSTLPEKFGTLITAVNTHFVRMVESK